MKFKIDENLPVEAADILKRAGYDSATVYDQGMSGASDDGLYAVCIEEERVMITVDMDFSNIERYPPDASTGVIVLRLKRLDREGVLRAVQALISAFKTESPIAKLWIVEEHRIRIRE